MDRRRILVLFGAAWISAALLTWFLYAKTVNARPQDRRAVMVASRDLPLGATLKKTDLKQVKLLEQDVPRGALFTEADALRRVTLYPVSANEPLTRSKLSAADGPEGIMATIPTGYRAVSVPINDVSGVSGLITPNSRVDVLFTRPGTMAEAVTSTILQNVRVLAVGRLTFANQAVDPKAVKMPVATLIVTPEDAQKLELAKNEGKVSLTLRNPLDGVNNLDGTPVTTEVLDPEMSSRIARARRGRSMLSKVPNLEDPRVWAEVSGEKKNLPPTKLVPIPPRAVVDVYRGDKHVQEVFHD
ncbi:MAG: Flp pilus assembly protein CpaB [Acidobacteriota bacterium]|nr:Flp pilus assembly protein CpaB [Acidobacteriota bacterium]